MPKIDQSDSSLNADTNNRKSATQGLYDPVPTNWSSMTLRFVSKLPLRIVRVSRSENIKKHQLYVISGTPGNSSLWRLKPPTVWIPEFISGNHCSLCNSTARFKQSHSGVLGPSKEQWTIKQRVALLQNPPPSRNFQIISALPFTTAIRYFLLALIHCIIRHNSNSMSRFLYLHWHD